MTPPFPSWSTVEPILRAAGAAGAHPGLVFDRWLPVWGPRPTDEFREVQRGLKQFCDTVAKMSALGGERLASAHAHLDACIAGTPGAAQRTFKSAWRFVTGLGGTHPIENGFTFHPTIGCPFVPGTAAKGLCRAEAMVEREQMRGVEREALTRLIDRIFGPDGSARHHASGTVIFFPALPASWPKLDVDIVNVHHQRYYQAEINYPSEAENPIPIYFLAVATGTQWVFRLAPSSRARRIPADQAQADVNAALELLERGLKNLGIGAKTAVGYGQMTPLG